MGHGATEERGGDGWVSQIPRHPSFEEQELEESLLLSDFDIFFICLFEIFVSA